MLFFWPSNKPVYTTGFRFVKYSYLQILMLLVVQVFIILFPAQSRHHPKYNPPNDIIFHLQTKMLSLMISLNWHRVPNDISFLPTMSWRNITPDCSLAQSRQTSLLTDFDHIRVDHRKPWSFMPTATQQQPNMSCRRSWDHDWLQTVVFPPGSCLPEYRRPCWGVSARLG
jgi:hypothetical protein